VCRRSAEKIRRPIFGFSCRHRLLLLRGEAETDPAEAVTISSTAMIVPSS